MTLTREYLLAHGWVDRGGILVRYTTPRLGWKEDGTLIVGYHQHPERVTTTEKLSELCPYILE